MVDPHEKPDVSLPVLSRLDAVRVMRDVLIPLVGRGVVIRRPRVVKALELVDADRRAVKRLLDVRARYGDGPVELGLPVRRMVVVLNPDHARDVLDRSPNPFSPATTEKEAALSHFQPSGVLISEGPQRQVRRQFNEAVLEAHRLMHSLSDRFSFVVREEGDRLLETTRRQGELTWDEFLPVWMRIVRRVVLGDGAAQDEEFTDLIADLRSDANWSYLRPTRDRVRHRFLQRLSVYMDRAEPGSLAEMVATTAAKMAAPELEPVQQVPQWLFAFDPAGMATFRALALLAAHPDHAARARAEALDSAGRPAELPWMRACVLESLRLWPTTPAILRETTTPVSWPNGSVPAGTGVMIYAPFFHRNPQLPQADRFAPEHWLSEPGPDDWPLMPFSGGPGMCPGRQLVLLLTSTMLAHLITRQDHVLDPSDRLDPGRPLPGTLDPYTLRFGTRPVVTAIG